MALAFTVGLPPGAVPAEGGFPLRGLFSWLEQPAALADVLGLPVQKNPSGEGRGHYVSADETSSEGGAGQPAGRGIGAVAAELPEPPQQKKYTAPVAPGADSFDEKTSVRVPERSGERFTEYRNADGSATRRLYGSRVNFRDADGRWQPIDTELTTREGRLETTANSVGVSLAPAGADDELATVTTAAGDSVALGVDGAAGTPAAAAGSVATYGEILPSIDLEAEALADGLRSTIVLKERPADSEWVLPLALDGLTARTATDGAVALADAAGQVALRMTPGTMEDANVDPKSGSAAQAPVTLTVDAGSVTVSADPAWLADPAREYPVRIGTTIVTGDARTDTFADADPATTNRDTDDLPVGTWKDGSAVARSYIGFDAAAADGFGDKLVRSATLNLFHSWSADCGNQQPISVRRVTVPFDGTPPADADGLAAAPAYSDPIGTLEVADNRPACTNGAGDRGVGKWWSVPLEKDAVTDWTAGEPTDVALALTTTETDAGAFKRFTSGNVEGGEFQPFVEVTAAENTGPQVNEQYPSYGRAVPTLTPELLADASDPDDGPGSLRYMFILYGSDGKTEIGRSIPLYRKSWTVPTGVFKWAESYYWSVRVDDGLDSNQEYLYKNLITTPVPQPAVTSGLSQNSGRSFDPAAGNYTTSARDAIVTTVGPALEIVRYYNSNDPRTTQALGAGWSSILDSKVVNRGSTVVLTYPNGREMAFGRNADGTFTSPAGRSAILNSITGGYRLWEKDGNRYEFLQAKPNGVWALSTFKDVHNRTLKLNWVSGRIDSLEAASGRKLYLTWDSTTAPKHVTQVSTDAVNGAANRWTYTYSGTALTTVCPPTSSTKCHSYQYADGSLYQSVVANNQPLSYYRLTETSGTSVRSSVLENAGTDNGTYHGVTFNVAGPLAGSSAKAVGFNGSARVALPASKLSGDASNQAVSMWFKAAPSSTSRVLYGQSWQNSDNVSTKAGYNPTLYLSTEGHLMGGFPVAPQPGTAIGTLVTPSSNECIGVAGNTATVGARLGLFGCTGSVSHQFSWTTARELRVTTGGQVRCIAPENGDYGKVFVVTATCDGSAKLKWDVRANGEIVSDYSYMCFSRIEVTGQSYTGAIGQRPCDTRPRALWQRYFPRLHTAMKSGTILADNDWHHVVLSSSGNSQTMYVDGEVAATQTGLQVQDMTPVYNYLGAGWLGGGWRDSGVDDTTSNAGYRRNFNGALSEVALFDTPVNAATARDLYEANNPVRQLTKVLRPSGNPAGQVTYDPIDGRVSQVTDSNGAIWRPQDPTVGGTTKVYESSVLAGVPNNYWRLNDAAATQAKNQINGETATYNAVELGWNGPFWPLTTAANFDGFPSRLTARDPTTCGADCVTDMNLSAVSMWFKTSVNGYPLFSYGNAAIQGGTTTKTYTALYVDSEGKLRGQFGTSAVNPIRSAAKVNDSKWHHVALVTWDDNQSLYLDGKIQGSLAGVPVRDNVAKYMYAGAGYLGGGYTPGTHETVPPTARGWMGQIAEVATYSKPLDGKMVEAQFKARNAVTATAVPSVTYSVQQPDHTDDAPVVSRDIHDLQGGRKLAEVDPMGNQTRYGYSTKGFLRTVTDPNGNQTINEHDVRGNVVSTATCQNRSTDRCTTTYYTYFPDATTEQPGASVMNDRLLTKRGPGSANSSDDRYLATYTYNTDNAVRTSETDALGRRTTVEYTNGSAAPSGLPTRILKPGGSVVTITYNTAGDLLSTTDPAGKRTEYEYDALGRTTKEIEVVGGTSRMIAQYEYDKQDRVVKETGAAVTNHVTGALHTPVTTTVYNDDGLPTSETVADATGGDASRTVSFGYDTFGRRTTETDALGKTVTIGYDAYGRVASQKHADDSVVRTKYDPLGNELEVTVEGESDPVKKMAYDPAGRLASVTDAMNFVTKYEYTDNNLLTKVTRYNSANGTGTAYVEEQNAYDSAGNLTSQVTNNGLTTTTRTYDAAGRGLTATLDPAGLNRTTTHTYSVNDDVLTTTLTTGSTVVSRSESMFDKLGRALAETTYTSAGLTPTFRWMFGEITAGSTADAAGNTRGVAGAGATWSTERGGSVSLTGAAAAVTANQPVVDTSRSYTAGLRVNVGDRTADRTLLSMPATAGRPAMELKYVTGNAFQLTINGTTAAGAETALTLKSANGTVPAAGTWTHLAASYDATSRTARLYVNGVALAPATATDFVPVTAAKVQVGHLGSTAAQGLFDEAIAFQSALTTTEAQNLSSGAVPAAGAKVVRTNQNLDADGSPVSATDARGYITYVTNDEAGRAAVLTAPEAASVTGEGTPVVSVSTTRAGYNTFGELTEQQDPLGRVSTTRYDAVGRPLETQLPDYVAPGSSTPITAKTTNAYNTVGQVASTTDPLGNTTSFEYDRFGRTTKVTAPDDGVSSFVYSKNGDLLEQTDPTGARATATYDFMGRTLTSTQAVRQTGQASTTTLAYAGGPWPATVTSAAGVVTTMEYNAAGEQKSVEDGAGNTTLTSYDGAGRPVRVTAPDNTYETAAYDLAGRMVEAKSWSAAGAALRTVSSQYDAAGNLVEGTDARGTTRTFTYDARGQLVTQTEPISGSDAIVSAFGYDLAGQRTRFTDGRGNTFVTTYNAWGLPESQIEPATAAHPDLADRTFTTSYDAAGRAVRTTSPGGVEVTSEYNNMGRLTRNTGAGAQVATVDKTFGYDAAGRVTSLTGSAGDTTIAYDDRGLPTTIGGVSGASSYTYNLDGALASRTDAAGTTSYTYDTAGRQKTVVNSGAGVDMTYAYNTMSMVSSITHGAGGNVRSFGYDNLHRVTSDELKTAGGASVAKIAYGWDLNDNLTSKTTTGFTGAAANTYTYDLADRLIGWNNGTTPTVYAYDKSGNRTQADGKTFAYDQRNQLLSSSDGTQYHYSPRGTLTSTVENGVEQQTETDAFNQVTSQTVAGGDTRTYTYDGLGRMVKPGLTYTGLANTVAGDSTTTYVRDAADGLVGVASGGTKRYAWTDLHTDVVGEFLGSGAALAASVAYDPWGKVLASGGMIGRLGYQSQWTDEGTGKVNMWARWYDPETGAFDTRDAASNNPNPASGAANRFAYAEGNPLGNTDTTGYGVDGKCGTYDYECELKKYQGRLAQYNRDMDQHQRDVRFTGEDIARQEADYQRAERESQTSLFDILLQVGVGMLLDMIGYNSLMGCLEGSAWDCVDLASNFLGPIKAFKMAKSLYRAVDRALSGYRMWRRIIDGARTMMNRAAMLMNQARKHLSDLMQKVPKKPKPPKKKIKPPAKKKPKPKAKPRPKPKPAQPAKPPKPKTKPKKVEKPDQKSAKPDRPERDQPEREQSAMAEQAPEQRNFVSLGKENDPVTASCPTPPPGEKHSFDPDTRVLMADGTTRPIDEVNLGDEVATTEPETGEHSGQQVTLLHTNRDTELTDVTVSSVRPTGDRVAKVASEGKGGRSTRGPTESTLETTAHHPFWDATTGEWVDAAKLTPGTSTLVGPDGQLQYVAAVRNFTGTKVMRDLTVDNTHTYYVLAGTTPVLVHNNNEIPCITGPVTGKTHYAQVTVRDADGAMIDKYALRSGGTTPEEAALGTGRARQAVHTEHRAGRISGGAPVVGEQVIHGDPFWNTSPAPEGGLVSIAGVKSPCGPCQKQMKGSAEDTGATFQYHWPNGEGDVKTWSSDDY